MPRHLIMLITACTMIATLAAAAGDQTTATWQRPAEEIGRASCRERV
jgi:hypothetical protein